MTKEFDFDLGAAKKAAKESKEKGNNTKFKMLKLKAETTGLLLLPPLKGKPFIKEVTIHEHWSQAEKKFLVRVVSPEMVGEKDVIKEEGWKYRKKYEKSTNKKLKDLWRIFMPREHRYVNCLNIKDLEAGPQILDMPLIVFNTVTDELLEMEDKSEMKTICDLDEGRILKIKHNGGEGINKKYEVVKFMSKTANLLADNLVEAEEVIGAMADLDKLEPAYDESKNREALATLKKIARKIEEKESEDVVDEDDNSDFDDAEVVKESKESSADDDDFDID